MQSHSFTKVSTVPAFVSIATAVAGATLLRCSSDKHEITDAGVALDGSVAVSDGNLPGDSALPSDASSYADVSVVAPGSANLWVDLNGGTCARSASPTAYADATACASLQDAFSACQSGDTIVVKSGSYGKQTITAVKTGAGCTAIGEDATVLASLQTNGSHLNLSRFTIDVGDAHAAGGWGSSGADITLTAVNIHGAYASVAIGGSNVIWNGGELGAPGVTGGKRSCNSADTEPVQIQSADHVTIDGVTFHPQNFDDTPCAGSTNGFHLEMVRIDANTNFITLKNSTFDDGDHSNTASVFITNVNTEPGDPTNLLFQNNFFGTADNSAFSIQGVVQNCSTFVFAYNTFHSSPGDPTSNGCTTSAGMQWIGNLGSRPSFFACAGTHTKNLWQDDRTYACGSDSVVVATRYGIEKLGLGGSDNFHLQAGSPAIDKGDSVYCTSSLDGRDHDGNPRPSGAACDVGAHERP